jgi:ABC-2 type transport system permease protein
MRVVALIIRILRQFKRDKRTLGLLVFAPILVLTMMHLVFNGDTYVPKVGLVNIPEPVQNQLNLEGAYIVEFEDTNLAMAELKQKEIDAYIAFESQSPAIVLEGSDPTVNGAVMKWIQLAFKPLQQQAAPVELDMEFLHGASDMGQFDYFGPVLLGFFIFFFVFLIGGVSFLRERTTGTLERLLSSPLRRWEIVIGYVLGFGLFTILQAGIIVTYSIYVLGMLMEGTVAYVLLITLLLALCALTLGIFLSSFANNELQMMQFIPIVIIPQIFFSGLFNLETISEWLNWIGPLTPLYYGADALRDVMVRGYGWSEIWLDILVLTGFSVLFLLLNILALKKYRKI